MFFLLEFLWRLLALYFHLLMEFLWLRSQKIFIILSISTLILFNVFAFGSALSINKGSMLGVLASLPLALPAIVLLGRGVRTVQYGGGFFEVSALMAGVALLVTAIMPIIISATLKTHLE